MSSPSVQRLMKDFKKIQAEQRIGLEASPNPTNIMQWNAVMAGPEDTPWDGGEQMSDLSLLTMLPSCKSFVQVSLATTCEGGSCLSSASNEDRQDRYLAAAMQASSSSHWNFQSSIPMSLLRSNFYQQSSIQMVRLQLQSPVAPLLIQLEIV